MEKIRNPFLFALITTGSHLGLSKQDSDLGDGHKEGVLNPKFSSLNAFPAVGLSPKVYLNKCLLSILFPERNRPYPPFPVARTLISLRKVWEHLVGGNGASGNFLCICDYALQVSPKRKGQLPARHWGSSEESWQVEERSPF